MLEVDIYGFTFEEIYFEIAIKAKWEDYRQCQAQGANKYCSDPASNISVDDIEDRRDNETENRVELKAGNNTVLLASAKSTSHSSSVHYGNDVLTLTTVLHDCHLTEYNSDSAALLKFTTLKAETLEERLQRFQLVMLDTKQIEEFENHFEAGVRFESPNYIWLSWLQIKLATIGSEKSDKRKTS